MPLLCRKDPYYEPKQRIRNVVEEPVAATPVVEREVDYSQFGTRRIIVKKLVTKGFNADQIDAMTPVIMNVHTRLDDIYALINPSMSVEEIEEKLYAN